MSAEADHDGDSQMLSSSSSSSSLSATPAQPQHHPSSSSIPSPPNSQPGSSSSTTTATMPTSAPGASLANSNGKRPIQTISNGVDDLQQQQPAAGTGGKSRHSNDLPTKVHAGSGYTWSKAEDEPGYAWMNKKALDEYQRAYDGLVHRDLMVKARFGDPFEAVEREQAVLASLKQT